MCVIARIGPYLLFRYHIKISHKFKIQYIGHDREQREREAATKRALFPNMDELFHLFLLSLLRNNPVSVLDLNISYAPQNCWQKIPSPCPFAE